MVVYGYSKAKEWRVWDSIAAALCWVKEGTQDRPGTDHVTVSKQQTGPKQHTIHICKYDCCR